MHCLQLRKEMHVVYNEMCDYVKAMANADDGGYYAQVLALINGVRQQYATVLAQRPSQPKEAEVSAN